MTDTDALTSALDGVLSDVLPGGAHVTRLEPLSGGASAEMWAVDACDDAGHRHELVLRCTRGGEAGMSIGATAEASVLRVAATHGVPVPPVVASTGVLPGVGEGYLMQRVSGEALPRKLLRDVEYAVARESVVGQAGRALAALHAVPTDEVADLPLLPATAQLDLLEALHRSIGQAVPVFELALRHLREQADSWAAVPPALVHGDFRTGNLLLDRTGLVAVLDWELAHRGDPLEDLGWFCAPAWRFGGGGAAGGFGTRDDLYAAYEAASGTVIDADRARFWEVLAALKWGIICQFQASRHLGGGSRSVELAAIGRRVTESELDLLLLLEGAT